MSTCLYLDTARLGQMCGEAQRADRDFARLAGEEAGSLYYDLMPLGLTAAHCDFLIAGCHKWLRAYHPMGLGFCCRPRTDDIIAQVGTKMVERLPALGLPSLLGQFSDSNPCNEDSGKTNRTPIPEGALPRSVFQDRFRRKVPWPIFGHASQFIVGVFKQTHHMPG